MQDLNIPRLGEFHECRLFGNMAGVIEDCFGSIEAVAYFSEIGIRE